MARPWLWIAAVLLIPGCSKRAAPAPRLTLAAIPSPAATTTDTTRLADTTRWSDTTKLGDTALQGSRGRASRQTTTIRTVTNVVWVDSTWMIRLGIPFGPYGQTSAPFTASLGYSDASTLVAQIDNARAHRQKLILAMTACCRSEYLTNGNFDLAKWKARQDRFNTPTIKTAIAFGVSDGTVIGAKLLDEPEHAAWGSGLSKPVVDQMAVYTKALFPTLPVGVSNGPPGYRWRTDQVYKALNWIAYQYNSPVTVTGIYAPGDVVGWRTAVLAQAAKDRVAPMFSLNLLDGGPRVAGCPQPQTGGPGTFSINCRMTPTQVRTFGLALGATGCALLMWKYDGGFFGRADNQVAFRAVADSLRKLPFTRCAR